MASSHKRSATPSKAPTPELPDELWLSEIAPYLRPEIDDNRKHEYCFYRGPPLKPAHFGDIISLASTCRKLHDILMPLVYSLGASDFEGDPHLIRAALRGCQTSFDRLLDAGAILRVEKQDLYNLYKTEFSGNISNLYSPLHAAAKGGQVEMMEHLLVLYGSHLPEVSRFWLNDYQKTPRPLDIASSMGHLEIVKLLKDIPFPNHTDTAPSEPRTQSLSKRRRAYLGNGIRCAARCGKLDIVKFLVEEGGALHVAGQKRMLSALELAVQFGQKDVVEYLFSKKAPGVDYTLLHLACKRPGLEIVQTLVDNGVDIFALSIPNGTNVMLHICGDPVKMRFFLEQGLDPNYLDFSDETPLHHVATRPQGPDTEECMRLLLEYGADPHLQDEYQCRPIEEAMGADRLSLVKILLQYMSNVDELMDSRWVKPEGAERRKHYLPADPDNPEDRLRSVSLREILSAVESVERA